ncbi:hypothetical protein E3P84_03344 [Wallemia ichthyophaga]|nr:hypothetical protein E3P84_03344 [Wallemia ichthyophaga]TIB44021.1 hypothetical protein E3P83_00445 [Wallemia ichthyophaga]
MVSVSELLSTFNQQQCGDTQLLITILNAKKAEDEYNLGVLNARMEYSRAMRWHPPASLDEESSSSNRQEIINALKQKFEQHPQHPQHSQQHPHAHST